MNIFQKLVSKRSNGVLMFPLLFLFLLLVNYVMVGFLPELGMRMVSCTKSQMFWYVLEFRSHCWNRETLCLSVLPKQVKSFQKAWSPTKTRGPRKTCPLLMSQWLGNVLAVSVQLLSVCMTNASQAVRSSWKALPSHHRLFGTWCTYLWWNSTSNLLLWFFLWFNEQSLLTCSVAELNYWSCGLGEGSLMGNTPGLILTS